VTIMRLMCDLGVDFAALSKTLGIDSKNTLPANSIRWPISKVTD